MVRTNFSNWYKDNYKLASNDNYKLVRTITCVLCYHEYQDDVDYDENGWSGFGSCSWWRKIGLQENNNRENGDVSMITLVFNDSGQGISEHHIVTLCCRFLVRQTIEERIHQVRSFVSDYDTHIRKDGRTVISLLLYIINIVYYYRTRVRSLVMLVTN